MGVNSVTVTRHRAVMPAPYVSRYRFRPRKPVVAFKNRSYVSHSTPVTNGQKGTSPRGLSNWTAGFFSIDFFTFRREYLAGQAIFVL